MEEVRKECERCLGKLWTERRSSPTDNSQRRRPRCRPHRAGKRKAALANLGTGARAAFLCSSLHSNISGELAQRTASAIAAHCIRHRSALRWASHRTAFFTRPYCHPHPIACMKEVHPAGFPPPKSLCTPRKILAETGKDMVFTHPEPLTKRGRLLTEMTWAFRQDAFDYHAKRRGLLSNTP